MKLSTRKTKDAKHVIVRLNKNVKKTEANNKAN